MENTIKLKKPYSFEDEEYTSIDLSGLDGLTMQDAIDAQKEVVTGISGRGGRPRIRQAGGVLQRYAHRYVFQSAHSGSGSFCRERSGKGRRSRSG